MINNRIIWFGRYEGWLRYLAHGVKDGDADCMRCAARLFDLMLPDECIIVPMPSHTGSARNMLEVANMVATLCTKRVVCDALRCDPHLSSYDTKKLGLAPDKIQMRIEPSCAVLAGKVFIIDNVIASGATASAALEAISEATVCALAYSPWR